MSDCHQSGTKKIGLFFLWKSDHIISTWGEKNLQNEIFFPPKTNLNCFNVWNEISLYKPFSGGKSIKSKRFVFKCWKFYLIFSNKWTNLKQKKRKEWGGISMCTSKNKKEHFNSKPFNFYLTWKPFLPDFFDKP